jgi:uncharacterized protein (TIGR02118 family)
MVKFMILFHSPAHLEPFENLYNDFLALVERIPGVLRRQVVTVLGSPQGKTPFYRILELYFDDDEALQTALLTREGQEAGRELGKFKQGSFETLRAEVYEEAGGRTESSGNHAST